MFLRTKNRTGPNGIKYEYLYLVENTRVNGKVVQRTVTSFGQTKDPKLKERINSYITTLLGKYSDYQKLDVESHIDCGGAKIYGPLLVFKRLWGDLGLEKILKKSFCNYETTFNLSDCIFNLVLSRLTDPCSKRAMIDFQKDVYNLPQFDLHQYYRAMDYLMDNKDNVEKSIYAQMLSLIKGKLDMAFFDTTTIIYFGEDPKEKSEILAKGFSKDHRGDLKQVVVGVVMSKEGIPLAHEVFAGNKNDVTCFKEVITKLTLKFGIKKVILVGDRGMISMRNIKLLEELGLEYILGFRMRTIKKESRRDVLKKVDLTKLRKLGGLQAKEVRYQGKRLIVYYDEERAKQDKEYRDEIIKELEEKTKNGTIYSIISNQNYKRYLDIEGKNPKISKRKIDIDELYDGIFIITSNTKLSANQVVNSYMDLWHVEQGFRWLKNELEMGPIYHWKDERILAHIMICFIALILKVFLNRKLKSNNKNNSYPESIASLKRLKVVQMKIKGKGVHMITTIEKEAKLVFNVINMRPPEKIICDEYTNGENVVENILV